MLAIATLAACLHPGASRCRDGQVCPAGTTCIDALGLCAQSDQLAACAHQAEGARCVTSTILTGTCTTGVCVSTGCGNGIVEPGEVCDDGNVMSGDGCSGDCLSNETCGNQIVDRGEQCDCGITGAVNPACPGPNSDTGGPCSKDCKLRCGDGVISPDEGCDPAASAIVSCAGAEFDRGLTTCSASCQPVISPQTCRYIGWRTRAKQPAPTIDFSVGDLAPTGIDRGFFIKHDVVNTFTGYVAGPNAYPASAPLAAVWAADDNDAVAVGAQGTVVRWNGTAWSPQSSGTTADLRDVWGRAAGDVYAVGDAVVVHWDGVAWSSLGFPGTGMRAIAGDVDRIYVVGDGGAAWSYDTLGWHALVIGTTADLSDVYAAGGLVVAVGAAGTIVQDDGTGWAPGRTATTANLRAVWGGATDGFFAAGERGTLLFYDGQVWRPMALGRGVTGSPDQTFNTIKGVDGEAIGVVGTEDLISYEGAAWSPAAVPTSETLYALWGTAGDDVFAVGRNGAILHHDGLHWTSEASPTSVDLYAVAGTSATDIYVAGDQLTLLHFDGATWTVVRSGPIAGQVGAFHALFVDPSGDVVAGGTLGVFDDAAGAVVRTSPDDTRALWGTSASDLWAAGATGVRHYSGGSWTATAATAAEVALAGATAANLYAVGAEPYYFDGVSWATGPFSDTHLSSVAASPALGVLAVGVHGELARWDGKAVEPIISRTTNDLDAVFLTSRVVFMAGADGTLDALILHR
jgi:cysteine-rich repeat protein